MSCQQRFHPSHVYDDEIWSLISCPSLELEQLVSLLPVELRPDEQTRRWHVWACLVSSSSIEGRFPFAAVTIPWEWHLPQYDHELHLRFLQWIDCQRRHRQCHLIIWWLCIASCNLPYYRYSIRSCKLRCSWLYQLWLPIQGGKLLLQALE